MDLKMHADKLVTRASFGQNSYPGPIKTVATIFHCLYSIWKFYSSRFAYSYSLAQYLFLDVAFCFIFLFSSKQKKGFDYDYDDYITKKNNTHLICYC